MLLVTTDVSSQTIKPYLSARVLVPVAGGPAPSSWCSPHHDLRLQQHQLPPSTNPDPSTQGAFQKIFCWGAFRRHGYILLYRTQWPGQVKALHLIMSKENINFRVARMIFGLLLHRTRIKICQGFSFFSLSDISYSRCPNFKVLNKIYQLINNY